MSQRPSGRGGNADAQFATRQYAIRRNFILRTVGLTLSLLVLPLASTLRGQSVVESARAIPIAYTVDVVVVGGSSGAVEAACEAARRDARVFLLAARPYLGEDLCATQRLWLNEDETPQSGGLAQACFRYGSPTTPFVVKRELDKALLSAGVRYLTGCYATDVLHDADGHVAGVVMANRSGRQAVVAKVIIDATQHATVARRAGVEFRPFVPGPHTFRRVVVGGQMRRDRNMSGRTLPFTYGSGTATTQRGDWPVHEYTLQITMPDNTYASFAAAQHEARDKTQGTGVVDGSETLFHLPGDTIVSSHRVEGSWPGAQEADLASFRPEGMSRLYVLSAYADLSTDAAEKLLRPIEFIAMGARVGNAAAQEARGLEAPTDPHLPGETTESATAQVSENLYWLRPSQQSLGAIQAGSRWLPVLGQYDVVVAGGGTSGSGAGIGASARGADTLVIEYLDELGGVGTAGLISQYWYGRRKGYTAYIDKHLTINNSAWNSMDKQEFLRRELRKNGADVWFLTFACGALVEDGQVKGLIVATPRGRGVVLADVVVDATGNADVVACAGGPTQFSLSDKGAMNVQVAGYPSRNLNQWYHNTCYTLVRDNDALDVWHLMVSQRVFPKESLHGQFPYDMGQLVDSRERRRAVGDYMLTVVDILTRRTFPDTISQHYANFDAASFPDAPLLLAKNYKGPRFETDMPYRCLLPRALDGILVVGLGASADRDAMTLIRMQADLQNQGYAAGVAAATAAKVGGHTREIDIKAVQRVLIEKEVLDGRVYVDKDSFPMSERAIAEAVETIKDMGGNTDRRLEVLYALATVMAHPQQAIPHLQKQYSDSQSADARLNYARILGVLGDPTGAATLISAVRSYNTWDDGGPLTSQRAQGNIFSDLDRLVIALGLSGAPDALPPLLAKLDQLEPQSMLSHYKAISLALGCCGGPREAIRSLVRLMSRPGFTGHAVVEPVVSSTTADRYKTVDTASANEMSLNKAFKELIVAAMLYRCGDYQGMAGNVLEQYVEGVDGHFAAYAKHVLEASRNESAQ